jgi:hypothetical protein
MKTLFTPEATFKNGRLETNQTLNEPEKVQSGGCGIGRSFLTAYRRPIQSGQSSVRGCDESDFMKSQLG